MLTLCGRASQGGEASHQRAGTAMRGALRGQRLRPRGGVFATSGRLLPLASDARRMPGLHHMRGRCVKGCCDAMQPTAELLYPSEGCRSLRRWRVG